MTRFVRPLAIAAAALAAALVAVPAAARPGGGAVGFHGGYGGYHGGYGGYHGGYGGYRGGYWGHRGYWGGPGVFWGGVGIGLGVGALAYSAYPYYYGPSGYYDDTYDPGVVVGQPVPSVTVDPSTSQPMARSGQPVPQAARAADPIFYPKNGQTAARTETDRQECNRWATTQPNSMNDASIFQRATFACMEGRGYTVR